MKRSTYWFCRLVLRLDRIPRYGRTYEVLPPDDDDGEVTMGPAVWSWHRYGFWGFYLLEDWGLLWKYLDEEMRRRDATTRPTCE